MGIGFNATHFHFLATPIYCTYVCGNQLHTTLMSAEHKLYIPQNGSAEEDGVNI